jgi:hypothetical protein
MTIENRLLEAGTKLEGSHKKTTYRCEVVSTPEGETRYRLEDGRLFKSPSSAAKAVMNGISANGCPCGIRLHRESGSGRWRWLSSLST